MVENQPVIVDEATRARIEHLEGLVAELESRLAALEKPALVEANTPS